MITLLRKVRKSFLSQGKFSSYLFYAIGEILLVVAGILIALQINNWNEAQKRKKEEQVLMLQLIEDLEKDAQTLQAVVPRIKEKSEIFQQLYFESTKTKPYDPSVLYGDLTWQAFAPLSFEQRHQKSSEQLSSADQRAMILDYFYQHRIVELQVSQANEYIRSTVRPLLGLGEVMNTDFVMSTDSYEKIRDNKSKFIHYEKLSNLFGTKEFDFVLFEMRMTYIATLNEIEKLLENNRELITYLKDNTFL